MSNSDEFLKNYIEEIFNEPGFQNLRAKATYELIVYGIVSLETYQKTMDYLSTAVKNKPLN